MEKKKWQNVDIYKWRKAITLTPSEGATMEEVYTQFGCENISQFCKKIVHGDIYLPMPDDVSNPDDVNVLKAKVARYERIISDIENALKS